MSDSDDEPGYTTWLNRQRRIFGSDAHGLTYAVADRLFTAHNRSKGALIPFGFGFLGPADRQPWIDRAQRLLSSSGEAA